MAFNRLALWCAILPTVTVHITWLMAAITGAVEWCNPYWGECHSISATGRESPQYYIFKALMLPSAVLMFFYWLRLSHWLQRRTHQRTAAYRIRILGLTAVTCLIIYTVTLGAALDWFALPRRIGVVGYFAFTAFAHLLLLHALSQQINIYPSIQTPLRLFFSLASLLLVLGFTSAVLGFIWEGYDNWDNAFEWWFAVLMISQFVCVGVIHDKVERNY